MDAAHVGVALGSVEGVAGVDVDVADVHKEFVDELVDLFLHHRSQLSSEALPQDLLCVRFNKERFVREIPHPAGGRRSECRWRRRGRDGCMSAGPGAEAFAGRTPAPCSCRRAGPGCKSPKSFYIYSIIHKNVREI